MNILIVEDDAILTKVLREGFKETGINTIVASNGLEALKILQTQSKKIDLVLLDLLMPVMDGFKFLEEVQQDSIYNLKNIPIIVLSNVDQDKAIKRSYDLGALNYFVKAQHPISEIVEKVKSFLERPREVAFDRNIMSESKKDIEKKQGDSGILENIGGQGGVEEKYDKKEIENPRPGFFKRLFFGEKRDNTQIKKEEIIIKKEIPKSNILQEIKEIEESRRQDGGELERAEKALFAKTKAKKLKIKSED